MPDETLLFSQLVQRISEIDRVRLSCDTNITKVSFDGFRMFFEGAPTGRYFSQRDKEHREEVSILECNLALCKKEIAAHKSKIKSLTKKLRMIRKPKA